VDSVSLRDELADHLIARNAITTQRVEQAFRQVQRARYLDRWYHASVEEGQITWQPVTLDHAHPSDEVLREVYSDRPLVTQLSGFVPSSSSSQPSLMARMLELLDLRPGMRILEIGTGTGYNAALLSEIVGPHGLVVSLESQRDVARHASRVLACDERSNVHVRCRDGYRGDRAHQPFDRIVATVACFDFSPHWLEQLAEDGFMLVPLRHGRTMSPLVIAHLDGRPDQLRGRIVGASGFMDPMGLLRTGSIWQSFLLPGWPYPELWRRPMPVDVGDEDDGRMTSPVMKNLRFFLALTSRHLWSTETGLGLADPATGAAVLIEPSGLVGYGTDLATVNRVCDQLVTAIETWDRLGRPSMADFDLRFRRANQIDPGTMATCQWTICRSTYHEHVRLAESLP